MPGLGMFEHLADAVQWTWSIERPMMPPAIARLIA
jgi:hypothetical protein